MAINPNPPNSQPVNMAAQFCGTCLYIRSSTLHPGSWQCRRYAPVANIAGLVAPTASDPEPSAATANVAALWPGVGLDDWCGDWTAKSMTWRDNS